MNLNTFDILIIVAYFGGLLAFGLIVRRIRDFGDYAVGGRVVPTAMIFASLTATYIGPGYTMGFTAKGFASGWLFFFVALAFTAQTALVAKFLAPRLHSFVNCYTIGDVLGQQHGKSAHLTAGVISTALCLGFAAIMSKVGGLVIHGTTGWPVWVGVMVVTGVGLIYCYTGGIKSVIATEAVQFTVFAIAIPLLLWFSVARSGVDLAAANAGGWSSFRLAIGGMGTWQVVGLFVSFFLGETLIPPYANRAFAAGSASMAKSGFLLAAGYSVLWFGIVVGLGAIAAQVLPGTPADDAFMTLAVKYLPHGLLGLLVVAVLSIIMSSAESILNAGAVSFTRDVRDVIASGGLEDRQRLNLTRLGTLGLGVTSAILALYAPSIIDGLLIIYSIWAPSVLPVLVLALLLKQPPRAAATPAMIAGAIASLVWQFALKEPGQVPAVIVGLACNLVVYGVIALSSGARSRELNPSDS